MKNLAKRILKLTTLLSLLLLAFITGAVMAAKGRWFLPIVTFNITNETGLDIDELKILCRSDGIISQITAPGMGKKEAAKFELIAQTGGLGCTINANTALNKESLSEISAYFLPDTYNLLLQRNMRKIIFKP